MNAADYKLLLTNVEKYKAHCAGLNSDNRHIWGNGFHMRKDDYGGYVVQYSRDGLLKSRSFFDDLQSALDFMSARP